MVAQRSDGGNGGSNDLVDREVEGDLGNQMWISLSVQPNFGGPAIIDICFALHRASPRHSAPAAQLSTHVFLHLQILCFTPKTLTTPCVRNTAQFYLEARPVLFGTVHGFVIIYITIRIVQKFTSNNHVIYPKPFAHEFTLNCACAQIRSVTEESLISAIIILVFVYSFGSKSTVERRGPEKTALGSSVVSGLVSVVKTQYQSPQKKKVLLLVGPNNN